MKYDTLLEIHRAYRDMFEDPVNIEFLAYCVKGSFLYIIKVGCISSDSNGAVASRFESIKGKFNESKYDWKNINWNMFIKREDLLRMNWTIHDSVNIYNDFQSQLIDVMHEAARLRLGIQMLRDNIV